MTPDAICAELRSRGYNILWHETANDRLAICFDMIGNAAVPWQRAFHLDAIHATPDMFELEINAWKADVRKNHHLGLDSDTVRSVIGEYGVKRFAKAMKERVLV